MFMLKNQSGDDLGAFLYFDINNNATIFHIFNSLDNETLVFYKYKNVLMG